MLFVDIVHSYNHDVIVPNISFAMYKVQSTTTLDRATPKNTCERGKGKSADERLR